MGKPTGSVWKETIAVSATIWISVEKVHHQIRLRILSCGRMSENHRGPEVPEAGVPVVECRDGLARITTEELAKTHSLKNGTLPNACFYKNKSGCGYQYCFDNSGRILSLRALQGHSGRNLIDPSLQDNVVIQSEFFHYISHIGCAFNLHSIINNGLNIWRSEFKQETDSILLACWS